MRIQLKSKLKALPIVLDFKRELYQDITKWVS